jgi:Leucine-rich repeat (LRR) protein
MENNLNINRQHQIDAIIPNQYLNVESVVFDDWSGEFITKIPDNFFDNFPNVKTVHFNLDIENLPGSVYKISGLKNLVVMSKKIKSFSENLSNLQSLEVLDFHHQNKQINWAKEFPKLAKLPLLKYFDFKNIRGTSFPQELEQLQQLESIKIGNDVLKKCDLKLIVDTVAKIKSLKKLLFDTGYKNKIKIDESFLQLDYLDEIKFDTQYGAEDLPPVLAHFKHAKLAIQFARKRGSRYDYNTDIVSNFQEIINKPDFNIRQREILFCFWMGNFHALRELIPNVLMQQQSPSFKLLLIGTAKRDKPKQLEESLKDTNLTLIKKDAATANLFVILPTATFEEVEDIIKNNKPIILEDQLNEYITSLGQHYLLVQENEELNEELIRLLVSNQHENYLLAFQIIDSGGANKTIQSLLAAIYLCHPDKKIQKEVTKSFQKYCSVAYQEFVNKNLVGVSLRKSGNSRAAFSIFSKHPDINRMEFILMYHRIAGDNPVIKDVDSTILFLKEQQITDMPEIVKFFNHFTTLNLEKNSTLNLKASINALQDSVNLQELNIAGSHIDVPDLSGIKSLRRLNVSFNKLDSGGQWLQYMDITELDIEGCSISTWQWLNKLNNINNLNISGNTMEALPEEVLTRPLITLITRNNKLKYIDDRLSEMPNLQEIDFANNQVTEFKSFLLRFNAVNLRSNNISLFEPQKYLKAFAGENMLINKLDLANNNLSEFELGELHLNSLSSLDISGNQLKKLDDTIFTNTILRKFEANNNSIEVIPQAAVGHYYERFWLEKNKITELPEYLNSLKAANLNLKNNLIKFVHPSFFTIKAGYDRANWKIENNPVFKEKGFSDYNFRYPGKQT